MSMHIAQKCDASGISITFANGDVFSMTKKEIMDLYTAKVLLVGVGKAKAEVLKVIRGNVQAVAKNRLDTSRLVHDFDKKDGTSTTLQVS